MAKAIGRSVPKAAKAAPLKSPPKRGRSPAIKTTLKKGKPVMANQPAKHETEHEHAPAKHETSTSAQPAPAKATTVAPPPAEPVAAPVLTTADEQRARAAEMEKMGVDKWIEAHDNRSPEDKKGKVVEGVGNVKTEPSKAEHSK